ncbi:hypothetical protein [Acinetobacter courvalinii]|uniref:hypothetical protein n=1 Tax=Acinetobacter courvalinii TaxID=280147 RepID=UPI0028A07E12|nr:hypothetical protein [Acinetobacter courvalinii]
MKKIILVGLLFCTWANAEDRLERIASELKSAPIYTYKDENGTLLSSKYPDLPSEQSSANRLIKQNPDGTFARNENVEIPKTTVEFTAGKDWYIGACGKDRFNGERSCELSKDELMIRLANGKTYVWVLGADYPGKKAAIKVDGNKTFWGYEGNFPNTKPIIDQMLKGRAVFIRYSKWPYLANNDKEISLDGFAKAYSDLKNQYSAIK